MGSNGSASGNGNGKKYWWFGIAFTCIGVIFGAGGSLYVTQDAVARHDESIKILTQEAKVSEVKQGRIEEWQRSIDRRLENIERMLQGRTLNNVNPEI